jgi:sulfofructose kinase
VQPAIELLQPAEKLKLLQSTAKFDVAGIGVSTLDLMMVVDEFPDRELVQRANGSLLQGGGPVATAMVALARLGCRTLMLDKVGDDWRGKLIAEEFRREKVSTEYMVVSQGRSSSIASILVRKSDGARTIVFAPGDVEELSSADLPEEVIAASRIIHLNGRHFEASLAAARMAKRHGVLVSFDGGAHRFNEQLRELISLTDICIVARQFAFAFSGTEDLQLSASQLLAAGPKIVVITAGVEGSWAFDASGQFLHQPAFTSVTSVDTTGAGDAYHGAFLCALLKDYPLAACAEFASAVAALNTRELGGRSALPSFREATEFLAMRFKA